MGRYTGPKHKLARREGINLFDKTSNSLKRRLMVPPGIHGKKRKKPLSEFGQQLREKQRAKSTYGLLEKQFKNLVNAVQKQKGETGELLIGLLETRLDSLTYRLGFANTRFMARQLVSHGHVFVNGKKITIPSYQTKVGDTISLSPKMQKNATVLKTFEEKKQTVPFLELEGMVGRLAKTPKSEDINVPFSIQLIIEYYSR